MRRRASPRFATRLLIAQALVLVAGAVTTWLVASVVGPGIFHDHLRRAHVAHTKSETDHVEQAFSSALLFSIGIALAAATLAALAVSWYFSRRVQGSIASVAASASDIAAGRPGSRVPDPGLGREFSSLTATYNTLAEKLEATESSRRRMLSDLAHEMRTPLATVEAHLEAVEDGVRELDADTLGTIRDSTRRLRRLAEDVSAVSRAEEGNLEIDRRPVDAEPLAEAAVAGVRERFAAKGVRLETRLTAGLRLQVDPDRIGQVLGNLLDNALRHTPAGGTVTVGCRPAGDGWMEYVVADTGDGIAAEHQPRVFDRFYRVDSARDRHRGGAGIGLSISRALVEAHGGTVSVTSPGPGGGSTFTVRLRLRSDRSAD